MIDLLMKSNSAAQSRHRLQRVVAQEGGELFELRISLIEDTHFTNNTGESEMSWLV